MRLKKEEIKIIKDTIFKYDKNAKISLFGSRVNDNKKGGDIDILIKSKKINFSDILKIKTKLFIFLGDRKVDIVLDNDSPFVKMIKKEAIRL